MKVIDTFDNRYKHNFIVSMIEPGKKGRIACEEDEICEETMG